MDRNILTADHDDLCRAIRQRDTAMADLLARRILARRITDVGAFAGYRTADQVYWLARHALDRSSWIWN